MIRLSIDGKGINKSANETRALWASVSHHRRRTDGATPHTLVVTKTDGRYNTRLRARVEKGGRPDRSR